MTEPLPLLVSHVLENLGFLHAFTTRAGGVSPAPYETLDFALLRNPEALRENLRRLGETVGFDAGKLFQTRQVHGSEVLVAEGDPAGFLTRDADALIAHAGSGAAVAVRVADCVPILLGDRSSGSVAAVHAGWRGIVAGVVARAASSLGRARGLAAAIGPCIGACCFEVGENVAREIAAATAPSVIVRRDAAHQKAFVDLRRAVRAQLLAVGLDAEAIEDVPAPTSTEGGCTRCNPSFYSYRRDGDASGRLVGVIAARAACDGRA
jgi:YfiH family protein